MSIKHDHYFEQKTTMANGNKKIYTWSITKTKKNTVKRTKGLVGDKSKTVQLVDKEYQSEEAAKNFIKKAIEKKRADGFVKKKSVTTATKNASKKASSNKKRKSSSVMPLFLPSHIFPHIDFGKSPQRSE